MSKKNKKNKAAETEYAENTSGEPVMESVEANSATETSADAPVTAVSAADDDTISKDEQNRKERAVRKAEKELDKQGEPFSLKKEIFEWVYTIAIALAIAFLIKGFVFDIVKVDGSSMFPTLHHNDRLIITKLGYTPKSGDIIILDSTYKKRSEYKEDFAQANGGSMSLLDEISFKIKLPKRLKPVYYVKRVIALPGQTVDIQNGKVYIDGKELDEPYYDGETGLLDTKLPVTVDDNCVFVMGDNRNHSTDSRASSLGQVPYKAVLGKSQFRLFPFTSMGLTK